MTVVSLFVTNDGVLGAVAPIGMAAARGTCLVVDFKYRVHREGLTLAKLVQEGPTKSHLEPQHRGVSFLHNGGVDPEVAFDVLDALCESWPNVLLSVPDLSFEFKGVVSVRVEAILAGPFVPPPHIDSVLQPVGLDSAPPDHVGHVLGRLDARTVRSVLTGGVDPRSRWVRSWRPVWEPL